MLFRFRKNYFGNSFFSLPWFLPRFVYLSLLIWSLSGRNGNRTHTHLIRKQTVCHLPKLPTTVWKLSKYGFFSGSNFPVFVVNTKKYGLEKLRISGTFHAVQMFQPKHVPDMIRTLSQMHCINKYSQRSSMVQCLLTN